MVYFTILKCAQYNLGILYINYELLVSNNHINFLDSILIFMVNFNFYLQKFSADKSNRINKINTMLIDPLKQQVNVKW